MSDKIQDNEILADCAWFADKHRGKNKQSGPHWSTIIRFPKLYDEAVRLFEENARLTARVRELVDEEETYYSAWKCGWCNERFTTPAEAMSHALSCETHPLVQRVKELEKEVEDSNGLLRSAFQIAKRDGKDTNWEAWRKQLDIALVRQHKIMYDKEEK